MPTWIDAEQALRFMRQNRPLYAALAQELRPRAAVGGFSFFCGICERVQPCRPCDDWNLRNALPCAGCGFGGRERHAFEVLRRLTAQDRLAKRVIFEDVTAFKALLDHRIGTFEGSEYLGPDKTPGFLYVHRGREIRHEDIGNIARAAESVDLLVSMDVLEHVPDIDDALRECHRVLRPGGYKVLTVPFYDERATLRRARIEAGRLVHLLPPDYHGNPVSDEGALVFAEPGIDLLDRMQAARFRVSISMGADLERGLMPDGNPVAEAHCWNLVFVLQKAPH